MTDTKLMEDAGIALLCAALRESGDLEPLVRQRLLARLEREVIGGLLGKGTDHRDSPAATISDDPRQPSAAMLDACCKVYPTPSTTSLQRETVKN